jgi:hypothetical protein
MAALISQRVRPHASIALDLGDGRPQPDRHNLWRHPSWLDFVTGSVHADVIERTLGR